MRMTIALVSSIGFVFALCLQVQATLFASEDYLGLRINLGDLAAPLACAAALPFLLGGKLRWPCWNVRHLYFWLGGLGLVLALAFLNGLVIFDEVSRWALVNKFGGWGILCALLFCGGLFASNAKEEHLRTFFAIFISFFVVVLSVQIVILIAQSIAPLRPYTGYNEAVRFPVAGLMANRNAYAMLCLGVLALLTCFTLARRPLLHPIVTLGFYTLLPFFIVFNGSRTGMIAIVCVLAVCGLLYMKAWRQWKGPLLALLAGTMTLGLFIALKPQEFPFLNARLYGFIGKMDHAAPPLSQEDYLLRENVGDTMRMDILNDTFEMVEARPLLGSGLGSAMMYQEEKHGDAFNLIDSTPLWLLTETGILGLAVFLCFFVTIVKNLFEGSKADDETTRIVASGMLALLAGFCVMCLFHEVLYTRYLWFLLGIALCLPAAKTRRGG